MVEDLFDRHRPTIADVDGWAIHLGVRKLVEVVGDVLILDDDHLQPSYDALRDVGNCSSATVVLMLDRLLKVPTSPGGWVVALAFGPGLTL